MSQQAPYNYLTFAQAKQTLAQRLYDSTETFWSDAELGRYIVEALRTFNALANYWREDFLFPINANSYVPLVSDPLNVDGPLNPAVWTTFGSPLQILGGVCIPTDINAEAFGIYTGITWPDNQWAEIQITNLINDNALGVKLRGVHADFRGYYGAIQGSFGVGNGTALVTVVTTGPATVLLSVPVTVSPGDIFRFGVLGFTFYMFQNDVLIGTATDPNSLYASGEVGVFDSASPALTDAAFINFRGGEIVKTSPWLDLTQLPNTLRPYTVEDTDLYETMEYHLLEPATGVNPWTGSLQFSALDLIAAVQRRRDEILSQTDCTLKVRTVPAVAGRITLPDTVIDVRRIAYLPNVPGSPSVLFPEDTWAEQSYNPRYLQTPAGAPGTPYTYLLSTQPPLSFDTDASPSYAGNYELLTVEAGPALSASTPSTLLIPDDWTWVLKWGALADLLGRESVAGDPLRAQYCESRYQMGLKLMRSVLALLSFRVGNVPLQVDSVRDADLYNTTWQGQTPGPPVMVVYAGLNLIGVNPIDSGIYSATATVVENAPIPVVDADPVQVSRGDLDAVIDYAQHLAAFKQGGKEFTDTLPLMARFFNQAKTYGLKLEEFAEYTDALYGLAQRENNMNPVSAPIPEDANA